MAVIGYTVWVIGSIVIRSTPQVGTLQECADFWRDSVPRDEILHVTLHFAESNIGDNFRLRGHLNSDDSYFWAPSAEMVVMNSDSDAMNLERYGPDIYISRGKWGTVDEMNAALAERGERMKTNAAMAELILELTDPPLRGIDPERER